MQYDNQNRLYETQMYAQLPAPVDPTDTTSDLVPPFIYDTISAQYDARSNVLSRGGMTAGYADASDPYAISSAEWNAGPDWTVQYVPRYAVPMTSFDRPVSVADTLDNLGCVYASYEYSASGKKARANFPSIGLERHYLGGVFERDVRSWGDPGDPWGGPCGSETVQRLFLGGNAYNAPMVLAKVNDGTFHRVQNMAFSSTGRPICHFPCLDLAFSGTGQSFREIAKVC